MADKDGTERRVYNLPVDLLERLRAYQASQGIASEAEAARRLLDAALQMRDTIHDILNTLASKYETEKDLRVLAGEVLTRHSLVTRVNIEDHEIEFSIRNGDSGKMTSKGSFYIREAESRSDYFSEYVPSSARASGKKESSSWEVPKGGSDLDDEIPF